MRFLFLMLLLCSLDVFAQDKRRVDLSWDAIPGAMSYEVELLRKTPQGVSSVGIFPSSTSVWSHEVSPGQYQARLRAIDRRQVPGEWSELFDIKVKLPGVNLLRPFQDEAISEEEVHFQWMRQSGALSYQFILEDAQGNLVVQEQLTNNEIKLKVSDLKHYRWVVFSLGEDQEEFERESVGKSDWKMFKRVGGELGTPIVAVQVGREVNISWSSVVFAGKYEVTFIPPVKSKMKGRRFEIEETSFKLDLTSVPEGVSTLTVVAKAPDYKNSKSSVVKILREKGKITSSLQQVLGSEVRGRGDVFRRKWLQLIASFGNGLYSATNSETDTKVSETPIGALGMIVDYRFATDSTSLRHHLSFEAQSYQNKVDAQSLAVNYLIAKSWKATGREYGLGAGPGVRRWPLLIPDRNKDTVTSSDVTLITPFIGGWWQDTLAEKHSLRLEGGVYYNFALGKVDGREVQSFASTTMRGYWQYHFSLDQALLLGMQVQALKTDIKTDSGEKDSQSLGLVSLLLGWSKGF